MLTATRRSGMNLFAAMLVAKTPPNAMQRTMNVPRCFLTIEKTVYRTVNVFLPCWMFSGDPASVR